LFELLDRYIVVSYVAGRLYDQIDAQNYQSYTYGQKRNEQSQYVEYMIIAGSGDKNSQNGDWQGENGNAGAQHRK